MYLLEEIKGQCLIVLSFCYVIMLVSKLTLTTNIRALLFISKAFCLDTVRYSRKQSSIITEQACIHNHTEQRTNSEKQP